MRDDLIARAEPLEKLRGALVQASSGRGGLALILGEAGIGKTSLVGAIAREAAASGVEVVSGRAWELAESPPYFPLWECFRLLGIDRSEQSDPFRLWERVLAALAERAARRTMVWVLDDLHAADLLTLDLLTFLARPVRATKLLILATAREKDPRISPRGAQRLARMARDGLEISLGPLSKSAIAELVERVSGRPHAGLTDVLFTRTEGNPLFAVECARMLRAAPPGKLNALRSLPPTVRQLVVERIAPLSAETRAVIDAAAVLGREFASGRVAKLLGHLPAQVIEALRPALDAGVVAERRPGHFAFTHILVRDAVEVAISAGAAVELHLRAEAMLAGEGEGVEVVVERARHALAALKEGAVTLAFDAARLLENEGAFDRALAMHERIDEARLKGHLPRMAPEEQLERARLLHAAGRSAEAEALCDEIAAGARRSGSATLLARAALTRGSELRPAMVNTELVTLLRAALAMPSGDRKLECRVEARLAAALQPARDPRGPIELARRAIRSAREIHDGKLLVDVLNWAGSALVDAAPLEERIELNKELFDAALREGEPLLALRAQLRLGLDRIERGEIDQWLAGAERVRELSAELGHPRHRWRALLFASMCSLARGDIVGAERAIVEVKELSGLYEDPALALALNAHLGQTARLLHRDDEIRSTAAALEQGMGESVVGDREIGLLLRLGCFAQLEDRTALVRLLGPVGACHAEAAVDVLEVEPGFFCAMFAHAVAIAGDEAACRRARARLVGREKCHIASGHIPFTYEGPAARICALLDARLGDVSSAERLLRTALAEAEAHRLAAWVAQIQYDLGRVLLDVGRASEAEAMLEPAERAALEIGMPGLAARAAERRVQRSGAPNTTARAPVIAPPAPVFVMVQEGDVWRLKHGDHEVRVRDSRGIQLLARLVERPGEDIHVLALGSDEVGKSLAETLINPAVDARARGEYKIRLADLARDQEAAESSGDLGRLEKLAREKDALEAELLAALGIGRRTRAAGSTSERARVNVQRRLKDAIARIAQLDPAMGAFLERAVRTGTYCRFGV